MELLGLPNELLREIAEWLWEEADLNAFLQANRRLYILFDSYLYSHNLHRYELEEIWESKVALAKIAKGSGPEATYRKALEAINTRNTTKSNKLASRTLFRVINNSRVDLAKMHVAFDDALNPTKNPQIDKSPFIRSCRSKDTDMFWVFVDSPCFDANATDSDGSTALQVACGCGHTEQVRFLLEHGADVNTQNEGGFSPLYSAAEHGVVEILELLAKTGKLKLNVRTNGGATALWRALYLEKREAALFLAKQPGVDCHHASRLDYSPIQTAVLSGDVELLKAMIEGGVDINYDPHDSGNTILTFAAANGCVEALKFLLTIEGAQVNPKPGTSCWPMGVAAQQGHARIMEVLLEYPHTDVEATDENGNTALLSAVYFSNQEATELILASGKADVNRGCSRGYTALGVAVEKEFVPLIRRLLAVPGINPELKDDFGQTPLDVAVRLGSLECAKALLENEDIANGSAVRVEDNPYEKAKEKGNKELEELLRPYYERRLG